MGSKMDKEVKLPKASALGREQNDNLIVAVYGDHGSGKTAWTEEILCKNKQRLLIVDTTGHDYGNEDFCKACHIEYDAVIENLKDIAEYVSRDKFRIVVRCPGSEMSVLNVFQHDAEKKSSLVTDCTIVLEEIHRFMDAQNIEPEIANIVTLGRHSRLNLVGVSQIPRGQTNLLFRSQVDIFISFRQTEQSAIKFFSDFDYEKAEKLRNLERGEYELLRGTPEKIMEFINKP